MAEHLSCKQKVPGSIPGGGTLLPRCVYGRRARWRLHSSSVLLVASVSRVDDVPLRRCWIHYRKTDRDGHSCVIEPAFRDTSMSMCWYAWIYDAPSDRKLNHASKCSQMRSSWLNCDSRLIGSGWYTIRTVCHWFRVDVKSKKRSRILCESPQRGWYRRETNVWRRRT